MKQAQPELQGWLTRPCPPQAPCFLVATPCQCCQRLSNLNKRARPLSRSHAQFALRLWGEGRREKGEGRREEGEGRREKGEGKGKREKGQKTGAMGWDASKLRWVCVAAGGCDQDAQSTGWICADLPLDSTNLANRGLLCCRRTMASVAPSAPRLPSSQGPPVCARLQRSRYILRPRLLCRHYTAEPPSTHVH